MGELQHLHRLLVEHMLKHLKAAQPVNLGGQQPQKLGSDFLAVVGAFLRQEKGVLTLGPRRIGQLHELYRLYCLALLKEMRQGNPSGMVLQELGAFLRANGVTKELDLPASGDPQKALQRLADMQLPFSD